MFTGRGRELSWGCWNVLYLDLGHGYTGVSIDKNPLHSTLKFTHFSFYKLYPSNIKTTI